MQVNRNGQLLDLLLLASLLLLLLQYVLLLLLPPLLLLLQYLLLLLLLLREAQTDTQSRALHVPAPSRPVRRPVAMDEPLPPKLTTGGVLQPETTSHPSLLLQQFCKATA